MGANLGLKVRPYTATPRAPLASYVAAMARTGVLVARHGPLLANAAFLPPGAPWRWILRSGFQKKRLTRLLCNATSQPWARHLRPNFACYGCSHQHPAKMLHFTAARRAHMPFLLPCCMINIRKKTMCEQARWWWSCCRYNWEWQGISRAYLNLTRSLGDVHHFAWPRRQPALGRVRRGRGALCGLDRAGVLLQARGSGTLKVTTSESGVPCWVAQLDMRSATLDRPGELQAHHFRQKSMSHVLQHDDCTMIVQPHPAPKSNKHILMTTGRWHFYVMLSAKYGVPVMAGSAWT